MVLALILSRTHRFYLPPWPPVSPAMQPSAPLASPWNISWVLWLPAGGLLRHHSSKLSNHLAALPTCPFTWRTSGARGTLKPSVANRNSCPEWLNNIPDRFTGLRVNRARCVGKVSCFDRTHLLPSMHWKAFLKLLMDPCLKTSGIWRQFVSKSPGFRWRTNSCVWLDLVDQEEKGSDGLKLVQFNSYEIRMLKVCDYRWQRRHQDL